MDEEFRAGLGVFVGWFVGMLIFGASLMRAGKMLGEKWPESWAQMWTYMLTPMIVGSALAMLVLWSRDTPSNVGRSHEDAAARDPHGVSKP